MRTSSASPVIHGLANSETRFAFAFKEAGHESDTGAWVHPRLQGQPYLQGGDRRHDGALRL